MGTTRSGFISSASLLPALLLLAMGAEAAGMSLSPNYYDETCPGALMAIRKEIRTAIARERRMAASLLRLHFHDCFVQGCDASILLDDAPGIESEKDVAPNFQSVRGYEVIDNAKAQVESICPGIVSCADIVAVAARDASVYVGGPTWPVKLGRRDSRTASEEKANTDLPSFAASLDDLISKFDANGLNPRDLVALSGAHTIGLATCATFRDRIYGSTNIDANFARVRQGHCSPDSDGNDGGNFAPLDLVTPVSFDTNYYKNLIQKKGLLESDQVLFGGGSTDAIVMEYSQSRASFYKDFAAAMLKMGDIRTLTGSDGEIRRNCRVIN